MHGLWRILLERFSDVGWSEESELVLLGERAREQHLRVDGAELAADGPLIGLDDALLGAVDRARDGGVDFAEADVGAALAESGLGRQLGEEMGVVGQALGECRDPRDGRARDRHSGRGDALRGDLGEFGG